jgi:hypothetical protein
MVMAVKKNDEDLPSNDKSRKPTAKKKFVLDDYKEEAGYNKGVKFKPLTWLPIRNIMGNTAFCDATGLGGLPANELVNIIGHTNTGKSCLLNEIAYSAQQEGVLPVLIITELKFSWEHLKGMGFEVQEIVDESTGNITYKGDFIFIDRTKFDTIEQMGDEVHKLLDAQKSGKLPVDLCFLIDSIGTIQSDMSFTKNSQNNEWDAGAISRVFGKGIVPRINMGKKDGQPYNNYMAVICQVWVRKPEVFRGLPKLAAKGGDTIPFNSTLQIVFGNVTNSGTSLLKAKKGANDVTYGIRTKVNIAKNHINGTSLTTKLVATPHGFLPDSKDDLIAKKYFKDNADYFMSQLGGGSVNDVNFIEENDEAELTPNQYDLIQTSGEEEAQD